MVDDIDPSGKYQNPHQAAALTIAIYQNPQTDEAYEAA